jgi:hypothetical protein
MREDSTIKTCEKLLLYGLPIIAIITEKISANIPIDAIYAKYFWFRIFFLSRSNAYNRRAIPVVKSRLIVIIEEASRQRSKQKKEIKPNVKM